MSKIKKKNTQFFSSSVFSILQTVPLKKNNKSKLCPFNFLIYVVSKIYEKNTHCPQNLEFFQILNIYKFTKYIVLQNLKILRIWKKFNLKIFLKLQITKFIISKMSKIFFKKTQFLSFLVFFIPLNCSVEKKKNNEPKLCPFFFLIYKVYKVYEKNNAQNLEFFQISNIYKFTAIQISQTSHNLKILRI